MPFGPVDPDLDLPALEQRALTRWREREIIEEASRLRKGGPPWTFYEGPPTANGRPGLHHVWARAFKDLFPRFQTMRGRDVPRKGGWDCHGLPVELEVEKELGLSSKPEIEAYGIEAFNRRCRESVRRYVEDWTSMTDRSGVWIDADDAYWTMDNDYIESVWWLVRQLWDKGLLYEGHRVTPYCGRCGTALSSHEVAQGYRDVVDPSIYVRFPLAGEGAPDADLLVWTTTPWTLVSNVAAAVGPAFGYVRIADPEGGRDLVLGEHAAARLYPGAPLLERWTGAEMAAAAWRYRRPFELLDPVAGKDGWRVVAADYVSDDDGSGIVHIAPAFGEDDARVGRTHDLPVLNPVGPDATFDHRVTPWARRFVKDADPGIIDDLRRRGLLVAEHAYEHSYPHCWRCGTPLIYWAKTSWFARTEERRADLLAQNETIGWHPEHIKHGRFGRWLEGNVDWALSRDRYWGTPLPIWRCDGCGSDSCVGSVAELAELAGRDLAGLDLHRPFVDDVTWSCPSTGCDGTVRRLTPVLDAWFDSGSMPSAQRHHPFADHVTGPAGPDNLPAAFPADFICEAIDQTRGWFYSLLAVNTLVFGRTPYRNVVCVGHIVDEDGQKMSKSRGNVIDPWQLFDRVGADGLRWYFFSAGQPWGQRRVFEEGIRESTRQTLLTLWNVFNFFVTYADLDGWRPPAGTAAGTLDPPGRAPAAPQRGTCSTGGCWASSTPPWPRSARRSTASTRYGAPAGWPASSTTCPTGTCAAAGHGSGRPATPRPTPPCTTRWWSPRSCWHRSAPSCPTSSTSRSPASRRCTSPTGPSPPSGPRASAPRSRRRWTRPAASSPSAAPPAPTPRSRCASRCPARSCCTRGCASAPAWWPRSRPSSTSRPSTTSTPCRG
jgi:isoleucyl-tRNA synthetase